MKKIIYLIYLMGIGMVITILPSCRKLIAIPDNIPGQLVASKVFADSTTAISGVVGIYNTAYASQGVLSSYMSLYPSLSSDDITSPTATNLLYYTNALIGGSSGVAGTPSAIWNGFYGSSVIYQTNAAIEGVTASTGISPSLKNQLIGECKVVRALSYFDLVNLFGPCPLAITSDYEVNAKLPRAPVDSVYAQINRDLADAINRLPVTYPSAGRARPNKYTAIALLSKVNLYRKQYNDALTNTNTIINSGVYTLESSLDNVFIVGNKEAIWQAVSSSSFSYVAQEGTVFSPATTTVIPSYALTTFLLNAFEAKDQRRVSWVSSNTVSGVTYYYPYKYKNTNNKQVSGRVEGDVMFRLAEQYLIRAEAKAQLGDLTGAAQDLNKIRNRAGLPNTTATTQAAVLTAISRERQVEFFCEQGHRWFDLIRASTANNVLGAEKSSNWPADGHAQLYPISFDQLTLNPNWQQNPGY